MVLCGNKTTLALKFDEYSKTKTKICFVFNVKALLGSTSNRTRKESAPFFKKTVSFSSCTRGIIKLGTVVPGINHKGSQIPWKTADRKLA